MASSSKTKGFSARPRAHRNRAVADSFVHGEETTSSSSSPVLVEPEPSTRTTRITLDLPEELHMRLKIKSARERVPMSKLLRKWIEENL